MTFDVKLLVPKALNFPQEILTSIILNHGISPYVVVSNGLCEFASMRAVRLFLRARAVINFLMESVSTLEITNGEQRALRKFPTSFEPSKKAKAKFCEHFQTGWDHSTTLYVLPEHAPG